MTVSIRRARTDDVDAMVELWKEFIDFHTPYDAFFTRAPEGHDHFAGFVREHLDNPDWLLLVAEDDYELVGYIVTAIMVYPPVFETERYGFVQDLAVTEKHRRTGVGSMMLEDTLHWIHGRNVSRVEVHVAAHNPVSQGFWRKHGFADYIDRLAREV